MKCVEARAVRWPDVWKFYRSLTLYYIIALSDWRQQMMHRMSGSAKLVEKIMTSKIYNKKNDNVILQGI